VRQRILTQIRNSLHHRASLPEMIRFPDRCGARMRRLNSMRLWRSVLNRRNARRKATTSFICCSNSIIAATATRNTIDPTPAGNSRGVAQNNGWFSELSQYRTVIHREQSSKQSTMKEVFMFLIALRLNAPAEFLGSSEGGLSTTIPCFAKRKREMLLRLGLSLGIEMS
jgi:hypothetical protein